jgi:hypothetical protein
MKKTFAVLRFAAFFLAISMARPVSAASITWGSAQNITGDSDIINTGSLSYAYNFGLQNTVASTTLNSVTFAPFPLPGFYFSSTPVTVGSVSLSQLQGSILFGDRNYGSGSAPFTSLSPDYQALLNSGAISISPMNNKLTLQLGGLTPGQAYLFQWWANDSSPTNLVGPVSSSGTNSVTLAASSGISGALGQFAIGNFTADATSQTIEFSGSSNSTGNGALINGFQLRASSDPTLYWLGSAGDSWTAANNWSSNATGT